MRKTSRQRLQRLVPTYLPYLLLSAAGAFLLYIGMLSEARRVITCYHMPDYLGVGCDYTFTKGRIGESVAEFCAYMWFALAQLAFYKLYAQSQLYSARKRVRFSPARFLAVLFCLAVIVVGFSCIVLLGWQAATPN